MRRSNALDMVGRQPALSGGETSKYPHQSKFALQRHDLGMPLQFVSIIEDAAKVRDIEMLRISQVSQKTGQAVSTIWLAVRNGVFPPPIKLSPRSVAWVKAEVNAVLSARMLLSRSNLKLDMGTFVESLIAAREGPF